MSENPYCMRCGRHLGKPFHETNEHDDAKVAGLSASTEEPPAKRGNAGGLRS